MSHSFRLSVPLCLLIVGGVIAAPAGLAQTGPRQYEITIDTTIGNGSADTRMSYMCMGPAQLNKPSEKVTGPRCPGQTFQRSGDTLTWTAQCAAAKGEGRLTFAGDNSTFSGESTIVANGQTVRTQVKGEAIDTCSL